MSRDQFTSAETAVGKKNLSAFLSPKQTNTAVFFLKILRHKSSDIFCSPHHFNIYKLSLYFVNISETSRHKTPPSPRISHPQTAVTPQTTATDCYCYRRVSPANINFCRRQVQLICFSVLMKQNKVHITSVVPCARVNTNISSSFESAQREKRQNALKLLSWTLH